MDTPLPPQSAEQRSFVLALTAHHSLRLKPTQHAPVTRLGRKTALVCHGTALASNQPSAASWWPMPRPAEGTPYRCCGQANREWGRMRTCHTPAHTPRLCGGRQCASSSPPARRGAGTRAPRGRRTNCVSVRPQPRQTQVVRAGWPRQLGLLTLGAVALRSGPGWRGRVTVVTRISVGVSRGTCAARFTHSRLPNPWRGRSRQLSSCR